MCDISTIWSLKSLNEISNPLVFEYLNSVNLLIEKND